MKVVKIDRQIPKLVKPPKLDKQVINLLTELCFLEHQEGWADIIFVFGSRYDIDENAEIVHDLLERGLAKQVVLTGGSPEFNDIEMMSLSEAETLLTKIRVEDFPYVEFFYENKSHHTLANVTEAMQVVDFEKIGRVIFVSKSFASRRCMNSLLKTMSDKKLMSVTYDAIYPGDDLRLTRKNWHTFESGQGRVWGEFTRIKQYGLKGDIAYPDDVKKLISEIENKIS